MCLANFLKISFVIQTHVFRKLSDLMIKWSEITIWLVITFLWCSRSWSWSDLRSLFEQVILIWSQITFRVILQFFGFSWPKNSQVRVEYSSSRVSTPPLTPAQDWQKIFEPLTCLWICFVITPHPLNTFSYIGGKSKIIFQVKIQSDLFS